MGVRDLATSSQSRFAVEVSHAQIFLSEISAHADGYSVPAALPLDSKADDSDARHPRETVGAIASGSVACGGTTGPRGRPLSQPIHARRRPMSQVMERTLWCLIDTALGQAPWQSLYGGRHRAKGPRRARPEVETLEDRTVPTAPPGRSRSMPWRSPSSTTARRPTTNSSGKQKHPFGNGSGDHAALQVAAGIFRVRLPRRISKSLVTPSCQAPTSTPPRAATTSDRKPPFRAAQAAANCAICG